MKSGAGCCEDKGCEICSRNDVMANVGVLLAAAACYASSSQWPDIIVGGVIAGLFLKSSFVVLRAAVRDLRKPIPVPLQPVKAAAIRFSKTAR
jgi:Co/Zn/Cd efflux system component